MLTGYTQKLVENGQTFPEFALTCARAFGACIEMRDDSLDTPIPEKFEPSSYHQQELKRAEKELKKLKSLNRAAQLKLGQAAQNENLKSLEEWLKKDQLENDRLVAMEKSVLAWQPPTSEHDGLKNFMLEQINISKNNLDYIKKELITAKNKKLLDYYIAAVSEAEWNVKYHKEESLKENSRQDDRADWIKKLRESV